MPVIFSVFLLCSVQLLFRKKYKHRTIFERKIPIRGFRLQTNLIKLDPHDTTHLPYIFHNFKPFRAKNLMTIPNRPTKIYVICHIIFVYFFKIPYFCINYVLLKHNFFPFKGHRTVYVKVKCQDIRIWESCFLNGFSNNRK